MLCFEESKTSCRWNFKGGSLILKWNMLFLIKCDKKFCFRRFEWLLYFFLNWANCQNISTAQSSKCPNLRKLFDLSVNKTPFVHSYYLILDPHKQEGYKMFVISKFKRRWLLWLLIENTNLKISLERHGMIWSTLKYEVILAPLQQLITFCLAV